MGTFFGTDGLRGQVNIFPMQPEIILRLGLAAGQYFRDPKRHKRVVIGKDTRLSGYVFESALQAGFCAAGMDVYLLGPMPTPAIAFLTRDMRADLGVVISASHNPFMDNGIKFFDRDGFKLADEAETAIADMVLDRNQQWEAPMPEEIGRATKVDDSLGRYIVYLKHSFPADQTLEGLQIVLDCANGAAYRVAPLVFEELGADVVPLHVSPNGLNINKHSGSLYPEVAAARVLESGSDIGISLDGDADRLILIDEKGHILDGDQIMAICALDMMERDALPGHQLVATVMSNMALEIFMKEHGGQLIRTDVGDRHVMARMQATGARLGGEQSGHLIFMPYGTTGDGLLAALRVLRIMREKNCPLSELGGLLTPFPQKLVNVHVRRKLPFEEVASVQKALSDARRQLADKGRVLLRYSGTEPVVRVMVEGEDEALVNTLTHNLADVLAENMS